MSLSSRVKQKRIELCLSQTKLARIVGMSQQSLQAIEAGETQRPRLLLELSVALNCEARWLLYGDENSHQNET